MAKDKQNRRGGRRRDREIPEFDQRVIDLARVARVVAGGRRFRFRATVAIGNKHGRVGVGIAKGGDVSQAIQKAVSRAKKSMIQVSLHDTTIPHEVQMKESGAVVLLKPAVPGTGIIAGGPVRAVVELAGIQDILSKMLGANNKTNNAVATYNALKAVANPARIMQLRGKELPKRFTKKMKPVVQNTPKNERQEAIDKKTVEKKSVKKTAKKDKE